MSLEPDVENIYGSYEFSEDERRHLIDYFEENKKQVARQIMEDDADWDKTFLLYILHKELSKDSQGFVNELADHCEAWNYSDQDWVDLCEDLIKELKK